MARGGKTRRASLLLLLWSFLLTGTTATRNENVGASVIANCKVGTSSMVFGNYDPLVTNKTSALNVTGSVSVQCTRGAPGITLTLDNGANSAHASGTTRAMAGGGSYLSYELFTDAARTTVWNTINAVSYVPTSMAAASLPVYGQIPGGQDVPAAASYSDGITVTVNF